MSRDVWSKQLRLAGDDTPAVVSVLAHGAPDDGLQLAGQTVLRCSPSSDLAPIIGMLVESLSARAWVGDAELIAELEQNP